MSDNPGEFTPKRRYFVIQLTTPDGWGDLGEYATLDAALEWLRMHGPSGASPNHARIMERLLCERVAAQGNK
jgi:hypothetical protein